MFQIPDKTKTKRNATPDNYNTNEPKMKKRKGNDSNNSIQAKKRGEGFEKSQKCVARKTRGIRRRMYGEGCPAPESVKQASTGPAKPVQGPWDWAPPPPPPQQPV